MNHPRMASIGQSRVSDYRGMGWYDATDTTGYRDTYYVAAGDACRVTYAYEHARDDYIVYAYDYTTIPHIVGMYESETRLSNVYPGDYCRIDSGAAWLRGMVARYGHCGQ